MVLLCKSKHSRLTRRGADTMKKEITKEELKDFPVKHFEGEIIYCKDDAKFEETWKDFLGEIDVFGVDTETRPAFKKGQRFPTAIIQICNGDQVIVYKLDNGKLHPWLVEFLNSDTFLKLGIAIGDDLKELKRENKNLVPQEVIDLSKMAVSLGFTSFGAKRLTALLLGFTVSKGQRTSDWSKDELSQAQLRYAATDAWICNLIFNELEKLEDDAL